MVTIRRQNRSSAGNNPFPGISLWLDGYDDIFSDFDPRTYEERNISDDFLYELKKVVSERDLPVEELRLLLPAAARDSTKEAVIVKRLHAFFSKSHQHVLKKIKQNRKIDIWYILIGSFFMLSASLVASLRSSNFLMHVLFVIVEPTGWFLVWSGLDGLIGGIRGRKTEQTFSERMSKSRIVFYDIPETST